MFDCRFLARERVNAATPIDAEIRKIDMLRVNEIIQCLTH